MISAIFYCWAIKVLLLPVLVICAAGSWWGVLLGTGKERAVEMLLGAGKIHLWELTRCASGFYPLA